MNANPNFICVTASYFSQVDAKHYLIQTENNKDGAAGVKFKTATLNRKAGPTCNDEDCHDKCQAGRWEIMWLPGCVLESRIFERICFCFKEKRAIFPSYCGNCLLLLSSLSMIGVCYMDNNWKKYCRCTETDLWRWNLSLKWSFCHSDERLFPIQIYRVIF